jgi:K+-transporting ATPase ATPase C chain
MLAQLKTSCILLLLSTILLGGLYPAAVTLVAQVVFPHRANGSLLRDGDRVAGSELVGQPFSQPGYFWGRLSATSRMPYDAAASSGSNFGPFHPGLREAAEARLAALAPHGPSADVPVDLVTASASGLDPHASPAAAEFQVPRVARARGMSEEAVREQVRRHTQGRTLGVLGEPRVDVLRLNRALDGRGEGS